MAARSSSKVQHVTNFICEASHSWIKGWEFLSTTETGCLSKAAAAATATAEAATATAAAATCSSNTKWKTNHNYIVNLLTSSVAFSK